MANDDQDDGGATEAFAALRAEVTVMRKAVEILPGAIKSLVPPDYAPTLGVMANGLDAVEARLAQIEGHPALTFTPEQFVRPIRQVGADVMGDAARTLRNEADAVVRAKQALEKIVGEARSQEAQRRALLWAIGAGIGAGLILFPLLGAFAPGGSYLTALAGGHFDRWQAGVGLMQTANPAWAKALANASRLVNANVKALQACAEAAKKAGREQKCTVSVSAQ